MGKEDVVVEYTRDGIEKEVEAGLTTPLDRIKVDWAGPTMLQKRMYRSLRASNFVFLMQVHRGRLSIFFYTLHRPDVHSPLP